MDYTKQYDVVVAGAGVAGIAAAVEAGRAGLKTALVEKTVFTGGLATTGLINVYLPLCDGRGTQVLFGLAEELLLRSLRYGPGDVPTNWRNSPVDGHSVRYMAEFSPAAFILALDEALEEAGVELWLDTLVSQPLLDGDRVVGLEVENKSGRGALHAACVIDATGDADVAYRAGAECALGENLLSLWAQQASLAAAKKAVSGESGVPLLDGVRLGYLCEWFEATPERQRYDGTVGKDVSNFIVDSRRMLRRRYQALQSEGGEKDRHNLYPITLPAMAQFRMTRRIIGRATLSNGQNNRAYADSVGLSPDWRKAGPVWEIPYGTLVPRNREGLLAAGRCISTEGDAWDVLRVIPPAAHTGQIAGLAAALAVQGNMLPSQVEPAAIQKVLRQRGIPYHLSDVGLE